MWSVATLLEYHELWGEAGLDRKLCGGRWSASLGPEVADELKVKLQFAEFELLHGVAEEFAWASEDTSGAISSCELPEDSPVL